ncbi:MAG: hypothetical protein PUG78_07935 [Eubacteriales bacterium]|nr:hypothetical protein [Clostridiales bacterium]MDD7308320.1 hypothetical protein [Eubacteriales bacterium]
MDARKSYRLTTAVSLLKQNLIPARRNIPAQFRNIPANIGAVLEIGLL